MKVNNTNHTMIMMDDYDDDTNSQNNNMIIRSCSMLKLPYFFLYLMVLFFISISSSFLTTMILTKTKTTSNIIPIVSSFTIDPLKISIYRSSRRSKTIKQWIRNNNNDHNKQTTSIFTEFSLSLSTKLTSRSSFSRSGTSIRSSSSSNNNPQISLLSKQQQENKQQHQKQRICIIVCPAQFCVPNDYESFFTNVRAELQHDNDNNNNNNNIEFGTCVVCDLPRTEWIKVSQQIVTSDFWKGTLNVERTLYWYLNSINNALLYILQQEQQGQHHNNLRICIIGHSIGGWVARAYLGGMSSICTSSSTYQYVMKNKLIHNFISIGTPHLVSSNAIVDQTRGLINSIQQSYTCSPSYLMEQYNINITCICSNSIEGTLFSSSISSSLIERMIALSSYIPLLGFNAILKNNGTILGDGIVPLELAFLSSSSDNTTTSITTNSNNKNNVINHVILNKCNITNESIRHSHVLPTPWNLWNGYQSSIELAYPSYISKGVLSQWFQYIIVQHK